MNREDLFWLCLWSVVVLGVLGVTKLGFDYNFKQSVLIAQQLERGVDPIAARCAIASCPQQNINLTHSQEK